MENENVIKSTVVENHEQTGTCLLKVAAAIVWTVLWMMPFVLGLMNEGKLANVLAIAWGIMTLKFAQRFTPRWMRDIIDQIIADEDADEA